MKKGISILFLVVCLLSLSFPYQAFAAEALNTVTININNEFGDPVEGVSISIGCQILSPINGQATFYDIPSGTTIYNIDTTDTIYRETSGVIEVNSEVTENVTLELFEPLHVSIMVRSDLEEGQMTFDGGKSYTSATDIQDAIVKFDGETYISGYVGNVLIEDNLVLNKPYNIEISKEGFETITDTLTLTDKFSSRFYNANLSPVFELKGNIYDATTNELIHDAVLDKFNIYVGGDLESYSIADGQYSIQFEYGELFGFTADANGYEPSLSYRYYPMPGITTNDFYLNPVLGAYTTTYVDENNDYIRNSDFTGFILSLGDYTVSAIDFEGYELTDLSTKVINLTEAEPNQEVVFQYKAVEAPPVEPEIKGSITIKYQDEDNNVIEQESIDNLGLGLHEFTNKTFEGYELNDIDTKSVTLTEDNSNQIIIFQYKEVETPPVEPEPEIKGSITIKYQDEDNNVIEQEKINDLELGLHEFTAKIFEGYKLNDTEIKSMLLTEQNPAQVVMFQYKKIEGSAPVEEPNPTPQPAPEPNPIPTPEPDKVRDSEKDSDEVEKANQFGTIRGKAADIYGNPIKNLRIELHSKLRITFTNEYGEYEFDDVELGDHTIIVLDDRFQTASKVEIVVKAVNSAENIILTNQTNAPLTLSEKEKDREVDIIITPRLATADTDDIQEHTIEVTEHIDTIVTSLPLEVVEQNQNPIIHDKPEELTSQPQPEPEIIDKKLPQTGDSGLLETILLIFFLLAGIWYFNFKKR